MTDKRIKDLSDISPVDGTYVPGDSVGTGTGKATIGAWVLAGIKSALAGLSGAVTAVGDWTFSAPISTIEVACSGDISAAGAIVAGAGITAGGTIDTVSDPVSAQMAATKNYVDTQFQRYTPTYTFGGAGSKAQEGDVIAQRCGNLVVLHGVLTFTPGAGGVAETITITMPTNWPPNNNFSGNGENGGASLMNLHAATDFCTRIQGVAGTKTLRWSVTTAAATPLHWWAQYHINN